MRKIFGNIWSLVWALILICLLLPGCVTYYCSSESLNRQLAKIDSCQQHQVYDFRPLEIGALSGKKHFFNAIRRVQVRNRKGREFALEVTPHTAARIVNKDGGSRVVYFDTMFIKDNLIYGNKSHYSSVPIAPIPLNDVIKVEFQD